MENERVQAALEAAPFLLLLQRYYQGCLCGLEDGQWEELLGAFGQEPGAGDPNLREGLDFLNSASGDQRRSLSYEFNRLFVGPGELLAPPYESCYGNDERTLMQAQTLRIRAFYLEAGLELAKKNVEPDDFLAFELEFLLCLLDSPGQDMLPLARRFLKEHLLVWCPEHASAIRANTAHPICLGMAALLQGVLKTLKDALFDQPR